MALKDGFPDDETLKKQLYSEFKLSSIDENNLKDIELQFKNKKIDSSNKKDLLEYLEKLHVEVSQVKRAEYNYEGEQNFNVNRYLQRIKKLIQEIERI